jgi:hypothetical protein
VVVRGKGVRVRGIEKRIAIGDDGKRIGDDKKIEIEEL